MTDLWTLPTPTAARSTYDAYTRGWSAADEAIAMKSAGHKDYSQGTTAWDDGWNARLEVEQERMGR